MLVPVYDILYIQNLRAIQDFVEPLENFRQEFFHRLRARLRSGYDYQIKCHVGSREEIIIFSVCAVGSIEERRSHLVTYKWKYSEKERKVVTSYIDHSRSYVQKKKN